MFELETVGVVETNELETVLEVAKMAEHYLVDLERAKDWSDLARIHSEISQELYMATDFGQCNPQQVAIYHDLMSVLFRAALSPDGEWPPRHAISDAQRLELARLKPTIAERLECWDPLSDADGGVPPFWSDSV